MDEQGLVQYALEHGISDMQKAYESWSAPQREQKGYDTGRQELEQGYRARGRTPGLTQVSRERSEGGSRSALQPHRNEQRGQILARIAATIGVRRDDVPPSTSPIAQTFSRSSDMPSTSTMLLSSGSEQPPTHGQSAA